MKKILVVLFVLGFNFCVLGNEKTDAMLFGDVKSKTNGEHIPYANILVKGTYLGTAADGSGHFKLANLPAGECVIVARAIGYKSQEKEVVMERGKAVDLFFELENDPIEMENVVVTGTRTAHYVKDVPVRTEVVTIRELENKNAATIYEALEGVPGIRVEQQCQYCNFSMVRMQGLGAEHTQVLINGQPLYSGLAGVYGLQQLSTVDIDRIEIVKGAGSALYGSSAVAGAINLVAKEPSFAPSTKVGIQMGRYNTNKYDISSSIRMNNVGLNVYAQKQTGNVIDETGEGDTKGQVDRKDGISDRISQDLTNLGFGLFLYNAAFENDKLIVRGKNVHENRRGGTLDDDYYKNPYTDGTENIATNRYEAELSYAVPVSSGSDLNFTAAYADHDREATNDSYLGDYMATHDETTPDLRTIRPYIADENSLTMTSTYGLKIGGHSLLAGAQGYWDNLEESGLYAVVDEASDFYGESYQSTGKKSAREFGAFVQDEWSVSHRLEVVPGVRVDLHHSEEEYRADKQVFAVTQFPKTKFDETSVNPRLAVKYELTEKLVLRANAGTGFRAPYGFSEDLHLCSGSPRVWKSSSLEPEKSVSGNFSADYYGKNFQISANLFRTELKNKIGFTDADPEIDALGYDYQWKNIDDAFVQGIELSVTARLAPGLKGEADLTYNRGEYSHSRADWIGTPYESISKHVPRFPGTTGNIKAEYDQKGWTITASGSFQGDMYIDYYSEVAENSKIKKTEPYMLFNAKCSKQLGNMKLLAGIDNIFGYIQNEKHLDDVAFMYAPVFGTIFYGGISFEIK
jgi:outer membrane receptor for ferrienterochelin and colicins